MRKIKAFLLLFLLIIIKYSPVVSASTDVVSLNTDDIDMGIIQIACHSADDKNIKIMIEKGTTRYIYDLKQNGLAERFPLQMGNGVYKISVLKNINGNRYSYLKTESILLDLKDQNLLYLNSIQNIKWSDDGLAAQKAAAITKELDSDNAKVKEIYKYIVENFRYDYDKLKNIPARYIPDIEETLSIKKGICYDFASLFASMMRSIMIPCKLVKGYAENVAGYHAWNEVMINGKWIIVDITTDMQLSKVKTTVTMEKKAERYMKLYEY